MRCIKRPVLSALFACRLIPSGILPGFLRESPLRVSFFGLSSRVNSFRPTFCRVLFKKALSVSHFLGFLHVSTHSVRHFVGFSLRKLSPCLIFRAFFTCRLIPSNILPTFFQKSPLRVSFYGLSLRAGSFRPTFCRLFFKKAPSVSDFTSFLYVPAYSPLRFIDAYISRVVPWSLYRGSLATFKICFG